MKELNHPYKITNRTDLQNFEGKTENYKDIINESVTKKWIITKPKNTDDGKGQLKKDWERSTKVFLPDGTLIKDFKEISAIKCNFVNFYTQGIFDYLNLFVQNLSRGNINAAVIGKQESAQLHSVEEKKMVATIHFMSFQLINTSGNREQMIWLPGSISFHYIETDTGYQLREKEPFTYSNQLYEKLLRGEIPTDEDIDAALKTESPDSQYEYFKFIAQNIIQTDSAYSQPNTKRYRPKYLSRILNFLNSQSALQERFSKDDAFKKDLTTLIEKAKANRQEILTSNLKTPLFSPVTKITLLINAPKYKFSSYPTTTRWLLAHNIFSWQDCYLDAQKQITHNNDNDDLYTLACKEMRETSILYALDDDEHAEGFINFLKDHPTEARHARELLWEMTQEKPFTFLGMNADAYNRYRRALRVLGEATAVQASDAKVTKALSAEADNAFKSTLLSRLAPLIETELNKKYQELTANLERSSKNHKFIVKFDENTSTFYVSTGIFKSPIFQIDSDLKWKTAQDSTDYTRIDNSILEKAGEDLFPPVLPAIRNNFNTLDEVSIFPLAKRMQQLSLASNSTGIEQINDIIHKSLLLKTIPISKIIAIAKKRANSSYSRSSLFGKGRAGWVDDFYQAVSKLQADDPNVLPNLTKIIQQAQFSKDLAEKRKGLKAFLSKNPDFSTKLEEDTLTEETKKQFLLACAEEYGDFNDQLGREINTFLALEETERTQDTLQRLQNAFIEHNQICHKIIELTTNKNVSSAYYYSDNMRNIFIREASNNILGMNVDPHQMFKQINTLMPNNQTTNITQKNRTTIEYADELTKVLKKKYPLTAKESLLEQSIENLKKSVYEIKASQNCQKLYSTLHDTNWNLFENRAIQSTAPEIQTTALNQLWITLKEIEKALSASTSLESQAILHQIMLIVSEHNPEFFKEYPNLHHMMKDADFFNAHKTEIIAVYTTAKEINEIKEVKEIKEIKEIYDFIDFYVEEQDNDLSTKLKLVADNAKKYQALETKIIRLCPQMTTLSNFQIQTKIQNINNPLYKPNI